MKLVPVTLESLSNIKYSVALAPHEDIGSPEFLHVAFSDAYRIGSQGAPDATFIMSIMEALQRAWFTESLIIDLADLTYDWGDEMEWIYGVGHFQPSPCHKPLAIIVGDKCCNALRSLSPEDYEEYCVETLDRAIDLIRAKKPAFDRCMDEWRRNPRK